MESRVERRLAAVLCADVVGYSRLIERDEAGTLRKLRSLRREIVDPLLATHGGRVVQVAGDGALVEFGSVVDAVQCAAAVQQAVAAHQAAAPPESRLVLRIGVNLGDVVAEGTDILGDGVNVASSLDQLCEPGGVLVAAHWLGHSPDHVLHGDDVHALLGVDDRRVPAGGERHADPTHAGFRLDRWVRLDEVAR